MTAAEDTTAALRSLADRVETGEVVVADAERLLDVGVGDGTPGPGRREAPLNAARGLAMIQNLAALAAAGTLMVTSGNIFYGRDGVLYHKRGPLVEADADPTHYKLVLYLEPTPELKAELMEVSDRDG